MKSKSLAGYIARITITLLLIAVIVATALAFVNQITEPIIAKANAEKTEKAIAVVLPGGYNQTIISYEDATGLVSKVYKGANGYAFEVLPSGFDGTITMMVGVDFDGNVLGISVVSHTESAGLGAVAAASTSAGVSFREQFIGQSGSVQVSKDGGTIDAITTATITSRAICTGVNAALDCAAGLE